MLTKKMFQANYLQLQKKYFQFTCSFEKIVFTFASQNFKTVIMQRIHTDILSKGFSVERYVFCGAVYTVR